MLIKVLQKHIWDFAEEKGFHKDFDLAKKLLLVHSEISEAAEDLRTGKMETYIDSTGKVCGFPSELADTIIRILDIAEQLGIDMEEAINSKMKYNFVRNYDDAKRF